MIFPKFASYKKVKIPWLYQIPSEWKTKRIKFSTYVKGRVGWHGLNSSEFLDEGQYYLVTGTEFEDRNINWEKCYRISAERYFEDSFIHLEENDLLITKDGTIGKLAIVKNKPKFATLNSGVFVTRPKNKEYDTIFLYYFLKSKIFEDFIQYNKTGTTINHLYQETFENFEYCFPQSIQEQKSIINFLDYKTSQIDILIEKKEHLLKLLEEKRIALITHTVTKGLSPNAKIKPTGIDWLGNIPENWEVKKIRYACDKVLTGSTPPSIGEDYFDNGIIDWFTPGDFSKNLTLKDSNKKLNMEVFRDGLVKLYPKNSVLLIGIGATLGKVGYCESNFSSNQQINTLIPKENINYKFLTYALAAFREILKILSNATTLGILNQEKTKQLSISIAPIEEQEKIVEYLDNELEKINSLSKKIKENIGYLKEYRTSLITSAVTGKIDVRNWSPKEENKESLLETMEEEVK